MALTATATGGKKQFAPIPEGVHDAVCYLLADLGTHFDTTYGKYKHQVVIGWEVPSERIELERDGKTVDLPRAISRTFTLSLNELAGLRKALESWRGKAFTEQELSGFDVKNILGVPATIQIMHRQSHDGSRTFANIANILPCKAKLEPENELQYFSFEDGMDIPKNIPNWIVQKIEDADEWQGKKEEPEEDNLDMGTPAGDDLPF